MNMVLTKDGWRLAPTGGEGSKAWPLAGTQRSQQISQRRLLQLIGEGNVATYAALYRGQPWVAAAVNKISRQMSRLPLKAFDQDGNGNKTRLRPPDPLANLLQRPFPKGSPSKLKESVTGSVLIYGEALVWKFRPGPGQPPTELWPIPWHNITVIDGDTRPIDGFLYQGPLGRKVFLPEDVIHFAWWGPDGPVSPLEQLRRTLALEDAMQRYSISSFANGARPAGALIVPDGKKLAADIKDEVKAEIAAMHEGPDNAFRVALLQGGMDWKPLSFNAVDAEVINHRKVNREEAAAVYGIDPTQIGILDRATFANVTEARKSLYIDTLGPWVTMEEETFDEQLVREEPGFRYLENPYLEFDLGEVTRADLEQRANSYAKTTHVWTSNEMRGFEGLSPIEGSILPDGTPDPEHPANQLHWNLNLSPDPEGANPTRTEPATSPNAGDPVASAGSGAVSA